jgi:alpha-galactosidase
MKTRPPKIAVIGAGSASFGLSVLGAILREPALRGSTLGLIDINGAGLEKIAALAERCCAEWDNGFTIESSTDRRDLLPDADFVILAIAKDREKCWQADYDIARKHGIMHYAENGGPGGFAHAARNIGPVMEILRDMEELCPEAWLLNFTNPVPRICTAAARHSKIRTIGICHQIGFGYMMLGVLLGRDLGIDVPEGYRFVWKKEALAAEKVICDTAMKKIDIVAAGINHFTWMLSVRERGTGRDLYPLLRERIESHEPGFEPLSREMARIFGLVPVPGDCHMVEYLPYTHNMQRKTWERYDIQMYPLDGAVTERDAMWDRISAMASGAAPIAPMAEVRSERAEKVIAAIATGEPLYEQALNLPNRGYILNLPEGAIVETPAVVSGGGPRGVGVGALPEAIAEFCRRQTTLMQLAADAAVTGDRALALQALALDPMVDDLATARGLLADYLETHRDCLTQFAE